MGAAFNPPRGHWHYWHDANYRFVQEMPAGTFFGQPLESAVENGSIPEAAVNRSVRRILTPLFEVGVFDAHNNNSIDTNVSTASSMETARKLSEQSMVLLQNEGGLLPLSDDPTKVQKIVLVGGDALTPTTGGQGSGRVDASVRACDRASVQWWVRASA